MRPYSRLVGRILWLLVATSTVVACSGVAAPAGGSPAAAGGGGSSAPVSAASQGKAGGQGGAAGALPDACKLLTPDEVKAQFTFDVKPGEGSSPGGPICNWNTIDAHPGFAGVQVTVDHLDQGYYDFNKNNVKDLKEVSGLGDGAFWMQPTNPYTLQWKQGDLMFLLYVVAAGSGSTDETQQQKVIALAKDVLAHL
jgi:Protein of unknown function (DUF3558)